jgi:hypothetical protein
MASRSSFNLPPVDPESITATAWLVWNAVADHPTFSKSPENTHKLPLNDQPGRHWVGSQADVIRTIWPDLTKLRKVDAEEARRIELAINRYLHNSRNMTCIKAGAKGKPAKWWVSQTWSPLRVTRMNPSDPFEVPSVPPVGSSVFQDRAEKFWDQGKPQEQQPAVQPVELAAQVSEELAKADAVAPGSAAMSVCRFVDADGKPCGRKLAHDGIRSIHEMRTHGIHVRRDGTVVSFDPSAPKPDEDQLDELVWAAVKKFEEPVAAAWIIDEAREHNPLASQARLRAALRRLVDEGDVKVTGSGAWERFERNLDQEGTTEAAPVSGPIEGLMTTLAEIKERELPTPAEVAAQVLKRQAERRAQEAEAQKAQEAAQAAAELVPAPDTTVAAMEALKAALAQLERLHELEQRLQLAEDNAKLSQLELAEARAEKEAAEAAAAEAAAERDAVNTKLDQLRTALLG